MHVRVLTRAHELNARPHIVLSVPLKLFNRSKDRHFAAGLVVIDSNVGEEK